MFDWLLNSGGIYINPFMTNVPTILVRNTTFGGGVLATLLFYSPCFVHSFYYRVISNSNSPPIFQTYFGKEQGLMVEQTDLPP